MKKFDENLLNIIDFAEKIYMLEKNKQYPLLFNNDDKIIVNATNTDF